MIRRILILSFALLFVPRTQESASTGSSANWSAFLDGNKLLAECEGKYEANKNYCLGYIAGVGDSFLTLTYSLQVTKQGGNASICLPTNATVKQLMDVSLKYAREHPEERHMSASYLIIAAWSESFTCGEKKPS